MYTHIYTEIFNINLEGLVLDLSSLWGLINGNADHTLGRIFEMPVSRFLIFTCSEPASCSDETPWRKQSFPLSFLTSISFIVLAKMILTIPIIVEVHSAFSPHFFSDLLREILTEPPNRDPLPFQVMLVESAKLSDRQWMNGLRT